MPGAMGSRVTHRRMFAYCSNPLRMVTLRLGSSPSSSVRSAPFKTASALPASSSVRRSTWPTSCRTAASVAGSSLARIFL